MPNKDIEKRREAWRKWYNKNKDNLEVKLKKKCRDASRAIEPLRQKCSKEDCKNLGERHHVDYSQPEKVTWLCKLHHEKTHSKLNCSIEGCKKPHRGLGMCFNHYRQFKRKIYGYKLYR